MFCFRILKLPVPWYLNIRMFLKLLPHKCSVAVLKYLPVGLSSDPVPSAENQVNLILFSTELQFFSTVCNNTAYRYRYRTALF